jgi:penicillin amidase
VPAGRVLGLGGAVLGTLGLTVGAAGAAFGVALRRALPQTSGVVAVRGLEAEVEIVRDRRGVPHIYARSEADLFFGQGYATAQDRFWQMELQRRLPAGRLAEIIGPAALEVDRFFRRIGLHRAAQRDLVRGTTAVHVAAAYAAGVNAYLERHHDRLPIELVLLRVSPEPWTPLDCLLWGRFLAFALSPNWESEIVRSRLIARLGLELASALEPEIWQPGTGAVPEEVDFGSPEAPRPRPAGRWSVPAAQSGASNNWVVSGARSTTGRPLLSNDPHLFPQVPGIWYEAHLVGAGYDVIGATLPGAPGVIIGHNQRIAWGVTAGLADVQDLYVERFDPDDPRRYRYQGAWRPAEVVREVIRVRGWREPAVEEVLVTHHGPIITPTPVLPGEDRALALRSFLNEDGFEPSVLLRLNRARDWDEFRAVLADWVAPPLSFVYADVDGNIGFQFAGKVPVRARGEGLVPAPGWTGEYEWTGALPFEALPCAYNPPEGFCATANDRVVPDGYPHLLTREWIDDYRARRIRELLAAKPKHSLDDFATMQTDVLSLPARELQPFFAALEPSGPLEEAALAELRAWDLRLTPDSVGGAIFEALKARLQANVFGPVAGDLLPHLLGQGLHPQVIPSSAFGHRATSRLIGALKRASAGAAARGSSGDGPAGGAAPAGRPTLARLPSSAREVVQRSFSEAVALLRKELGGDVRKWTWGRLHQLTIPHALGARAPLGVLFNLGPFAVGGDQETVCQIAPHPARQFQAGAWIPSYRLVVDLADLDRSRSVLPGGQSGHRASPHYADQIGAWLEGRLLPLPFSRRAVEADQATRLLLRPEA